jgi:hypothetical protein
MAIAFYGDDRSALQRELEGLRRQWPSLERTQLLRHPIDGVRLCDLRGRAAATLALGAPPQEKRALLREARQVAGWLDRRPAAWARPHADLLRGIVAAAEGEASASFLEKAAGGFAAAGLPMHAAALERRLGRAPEWFTRERIRDPEAFTRIFVPPLS